MDVRTERNKSSAGFLLTDAQDNLRVVMIDPVTGESVLPSGVPTDERGFVLAPRTSFRAKRGTTATNGVYSNVGKLNVAPNGTVGKRGDRITKLRAEVKAVSNGAKAAIYLTQLSDSIHGMNLGVSVGSAVQAGTSLTLNTNGTSIANAPANYLDGRLVTFLYQPANSPVPHWGMTRIVSHAAITTNSFTLTVEDTLEEGGVITE